MWPCSCQFAARTWVDLFSPKTPNERQPVATTTHNRPWVFHFPALCSLTSGDNDEWRRTDTVNPGSTIAPEHRSMTDHDRSQNVGTRMQLARGPSLFPLVPSSKTHVSKSTIKDIYLRAISKIAELPLLGPCAILSLYAHMKKDTKAPPLNCRPWIGTRKFSRGTNVHLDRPRHHTHLFVRDEGPENLAGHAGPSAAPTQLRPRSICIP